MKPRPRKRFGQHFLEPAWADRVVDAIDPQPSDRFLEIGPGPGVLTRRLAPRVSHLTAIEVDRDLAAALAHEALPNVDVVAGDVLEIDPGPVVGGEPLRIAGNLPYNISSPILFRLLDWGRRFRKIADATLMVQQEFADRLVAAVGTKDYGVLTIFTTMAAEVRRLFDLPPGAFRPVPRVRSSVVRLRFRPAGVAVRSETTFTEVVRSVFTQRRKTMANATRTVAESRRVTAAAALADAGIDPRRRPETLTIEEFARLANVLSRDVPPA
ncbi:MAG TPA: 16S rRNA (adenine(1518)-N(6)/adenine(1519)-N(6))-dimethyltransferase RsmA [Vicinamibacterales bacterium]|jgi:16S rRNA (adenine1518-N6/adenine1519-N6)-dimethyltransferase|nr:16S rRNA (adenine(1518)-N(6)/adenine(1519)-N(6))-dimethyltransferase RsmA [Vicinamibacterales bacterium]